MDMEFRIEHKDAFRVVGLVIHTTSENNLCRKEVPSLWGEVIQSNKMNEIMELSNQSPSEIMGINVYNTKSLIIILQVQPVSQYKMGWLNTQFLLLHGRFFLVKERKFQKLKYVLSLPCSACLCHGGRDFIVRIHKEQMVVCGSDGTSRQGTQSY